MTRINRREFSGQEIITILSEYALKEQTLGEGSFAVEGWLEALDNEEGWIVNDATVCAYVEIFRKEQA